MARFLAVRRLLLALVQGERLTSSAMIERGCSAPLGRFGCAMPANRYRAPPMTLAGKALQKEASQSRSGVILSSMTDPTPPPYELAVRACTIHAGRYRWEIRQIGMPVQTSIESFATAHEAHADGRQVIEKLLQVPRTGR